VTTRTTIADALGTEVTAVPSPLVGLSRRSIARLANAWILTIKVTRIAKGNAVWHNTKAMAIATTKTTTAVASTMVAIVARKHLGSPLIRNTAKNVNAWILMVKVTPTVKGLVVRRTTKAMATATTTITTVAARTMVAIVARKHLGSLSARNTAKNANVWTRMVKLTPTAKALVVRRTTKAMATATTTITIVVASTTEAIAARNRLGSLSTRNTAKNANVWTLRTSLALHVTQTQTSAGMQNTKAMAIATTTTTTVVARTTAVTAALKHSRNPLSKNTAKSASAWIRMANKPLFFLGRFSVR